MSIDLLILIVTVVVNTGLAVSLWCIHQGRNEKLLLAMTGLIIFWAICNFSVDSSPDPETALFWIRCLYASAIGYIFVFYILVRSFSSLQPLPSKLIPLLLQLGTITAVACTLFTPYVFSDADIDIGGLSSLEFGQLYMPFNGLALTTVLLGIAEVINKVRTATSKFLRVQFTLISLSWISFSLLVILFGAILPYFFPSFINTSKITPLFSIIVVAGISYAIAYSFNHFQTNQEELMHDFSHALQTPLAILISAIELVARDNSNPEPIKLATGSAYEMSNLLAHLPNLAKTGRGYKNDKWSYFSITNLLNEIYEYVQIICLSNNIEISCSVEADIHIYGNKFELKEAITNILSNAVKYTTNCPVRQIELLVTKDSNYVEITVKDTGLGISKKDLHKIFERFYTGGKRPGTGLGLAIAKKIIERHSGSITVNSELGVGTSIKIQLPVKDHFNA